MTESLIPFDAAQRWLRRYCEGQAAVRSAVVLLASGHALQEGARWPTEAPASASLLAAARAAFKRECSVVLTPPVGDHAAGELVRVLALPVIGAHGAPVAALAISAVGDVSDTGQTSASELEHACANLGATLEATNASRASAAGNRLLQLQALLLGPQALEQAGSALASELASTLELERVSMGLVQGAGLNVVALSHGAEFSSRQGLIQALADAMQEAIDQGVSIAYPQADDAPPRIVQAHARLGPLGPGALLTVPLISAGNAIGALCFERGTAIDAEAVRHIEQLACALAPLIELKRRAEQPWTARARESLRARFAGRSHRVRRVTWLAGLSAALFLAFVPVAHRVGAPARLEGAVQRVLAAPTDGYLHAAHARPGDAVRAGQLLVELAQQDLVLQTQKWEAELTQHENSAAAALARADRTQYALAAARATEASVQLELARAQLARTQLTAPIEGIIIKGDLSQSLGAPVQRGEVLVTLAPRDTFRLIIEVDERDIEAVALGQRGRLALAALPSERLAFRVTRISPVAVTHDGRNAFEVEAAFDNPPAGLRPGLQGIAKIDVGAQPLGWIATRRIWTWLELKLWGWVG